MKLWWVIVFCLPMSAGFAKEKSAPGDTLKRVDELASEIDRLFSDIRTGLKGGLKESNHSMEELRHSLRRLEGELEESLREKPEKKVPAKEKKALLDKFRTFVQGLGDDVMEEVHETVKRLTKISEETK